MDTDHPKIDVVDSNKRSYCLLFIFKKFGFSSFSNNTNSARLFNIHFIDEPAAIVNFLCCNLGINGEVSVHIITTRFLTSNRQSRATSKNTGSISWSDVLNLWNSFFQNIDIPQSKLNSSTCTKTFIRFACRLRPSKQRIHCNRLKLSFKTIV